MKITWIGHSCFRIESGNFALILDPYEDNSVPGLMPVRETANQVLCSHGHSDHNASDRIRLTYAGVNPFTITKIHTYHDDAKGAKRGENTIHIIDDGMCRAVHFGDLGCSLEPEQIKQLENADVVMIPVGGFYTIDAAQAAQLVQKISPRIVIPMHYKDMSRGFGFDVISTADEFTSRMEQVAVMQSSSIDTSEKLQAQVIVMQPENVRN